MEPTSPGYEPEGDLLKRAPDGGFVTPVLCVPLREPHSVTSQGTQVLPMGCRLFVAMVSFLIRADSPKVVVNGPARDRRAAPLWRPARSTSS